ncbi:MAG: LytTR family DNA-binding domain-containing protein [Flavobacteriaceae bacterium]
MFRFVPFILFFLSLFSISTGHTQNNKIDEYIEKCKTHFRNSDSLFYYSNLLIQFDDNKAKAEGYYARGYAHKNNMQLDSALFFFDKAETYVTDNDFDYLTKIARLSSITATQASEFEKALFYAEKMKQVASEKGDSSAYATAINQEGVVFKNKGDLNAAIKKYTEAGKIQKSNNLPQLPYTHTNIAVAYTEMKLDSMSLIWFHKAYKSALEVKDSTIIVRSINNLGTFYKIQKNIDSSLYYFNKLLKNEMRLRADQRSLLHLNLADLNTKAEKDEKARYFYNKAESVINKGQNPRRKIELLTVLLQMEKKQNNNAKVLQISDSLISWIQAANLPNKLLPVYLEKAEVLKNQGDFEKAVIALDKYNRVKDSLSRFQDAATIQRIVSEFELAEKEMELQASLANSDNSLKTISIVSVASFLILLTFLYYLFLNKKNKIANANEKNKLKQITLKTKRILNCNEILYVKSDGHYLEYYLTGTEQPVIERNKLKTTLDLLKDCDFIQVHRSYIVNLTKIKAVYASSILLENNEEVPLSRSFKQKHKEEKQTLFQ